jgi:hypothetical protein
MVKAESLLAPAAMSVVVWADRLSGLGKPETIPREFHAEPSKDAA